MVEVLTSLLSPYWERRAKLEKDPDFVWGVLEEGSQKARLKAQETMAEVREAMGLY
jgi:tryptophanyl-tRNA synthetase